MTDTIKAVTPQQFHDVVGFDDWRVLGDGACAYFRTASFPAAAGFVQAIGELAGTDDRPPHIDLRAGGVTVRLITVTPEHYGLTERDVALAERISAVARERGLPADPASLQNVQVCVDALVIADVLPFWRAVLGYVDRGDTPEDLIDPRARGPLAYFQQMDAPRPQRNRIHLDIWVAHDQAEARVAAAIAAGGRLVTDEFAPHWWVLADSEGNEACVCTWMTRDG
jgi:4a-hydroxytetrahydrobiopterin dehydratase